MGTSRTPRELSDKFRKAAAGLEGANRQAVVAAANVYKASVLLQAAKDVGADRRMSNWGRKGVKLGAGYTVRESGAKTTAVLTPRPAGVWSALSTGTAPHDIYPGANRPGRRRRAGKKALAFGGRHAAKVSHPGASGKQTWQRGVKIAEPRARRAFGVAHRRSLTKVFR